jgi:hypothetical protein
MRIGAGNANRRARVSKDEDEPALFALETHRSAPEAWEHLYPRCNASQHEGARGGDGPITPRRMIAPPRGACLRLPDRGAPPRSKFP